jgi:transglutaminase-like putative cysteine protease
MNRYHLVHVTEFRYDGPVTESYNEVRLRPMHDERQSCLSFRLGITPAARTIAYHDGYGNWVHHFNVPVPHRYLKVEAESVVLMHDAEPPARESLSLAELNAQAAELHEELYDFLAPTAYVPYLDELREYVAAAEQACDGSVSGFALAASEEVHRRIRYVKGATQVHSSIEDSLRLQAGVCQDFAHLLLGTIRSRGVPSRYVSGYLVPKPAMDGAHSVEEVIGGQASHAWVEAYLPGSGWLGLDPTLGAPVGLRHVRVAYGRDYGDVAPVRGVYKGHAGQRLSVDVRVRPVLDSEGREQLEESAAGPVEPEPAERPQQPAQQQQ